LLTAICLLAFIPASAQGGGKAEANRIEFAKGKSSSTLTGTLKVGEIMEYVFGAKAGQAVTVSNPSKLFGFKVFSEENFDEADFDSSPNYTFEVPADGDYNLFIRRKVGGPRRAAFRITLTIK
jgi:hypothetical protein